MRYPFVGGDDVVGLCQLLERWGDVALDVVLGCEVGDVVKSGVCGEKIRSTE